jgi:hypothetical protein
VSNRYLKDSTLREIFVADTGLDADDLKISKIIDANIKSHPEAFGGNCSRYDAGCMPKICGVKGSDPCEAELAVKMSASPSPGASVLRKGYTSRTCEEILAVDKSVTTALTKAEIKNETQINPLPNSDNIQAFLNFYYSDRPSTKESLETLEKLVSDAKSKGMSTLDQWRFVILPICMSTGADLL